MDIRNTKIVITGPESTGKTELAMYLCRTMLIDYIPEYARGYIEELDRSYTFEDVTHIAKTQVEQLRGAEQKDDTLIILDTYLVITKVWFQEVFGKVPQWIDPLLKNTGIDLFLLCDYDLEWILDPVRENPGEKRAYLFDRYRDEIEKLDIPWAPISGMGTERTRNAREAILNHLPHLQNRLE